MKRNRHDRRAAAIARAQEMARPFSGRTCDPCNVEWVSGPAIGRMSADYLRALRDRDAQEFWQSATPSATPQGGLMGSRYVGGASVRPRCS